MKEEDLGTESVKSLIQDWYNLAEYRVNLPSILNCLVTFDPSGVMVLGKSILACAGVRPGDRLSVSINPHLPNANQEPSEIQLLHFVRLLDEKHSPPTAHVITVDSEHKATLCLSKDKIFQIPESMLDAFEVKLRKNGEFALFALESRSQAKYAYICSSANEKARNEEWIDAITDYSQSISINRRYWHAYANRAHAVWELFKQAPDEVIDYVMPYILGDYEQAISISPCFPEAFMNRGWMYYSWVESMNSIDSIKLTRVAMLTQSLNDLSRAIEQDPGNPEAFIRRAYVHKLMNNNQDAIEDLQSACVIGSAEASRLINDFA